MAIRYTFNQSTEYFCKIKEDSVDQTCQHLYDDLVNRLSLSVTNFKGELVEITPSQKISEYFAKSGEHQVVVSLKEINLNEIRVNKYALVPIEEETIQIIIDNKLGGRQEINPNDTLDDFISNILCQHHYQIESYQLKKESGEIVQLLPNLILGQFIKKLQIFSINIITTEKSQNSSQLRQKQYYEPQNFNDHSMSSHEIPQQVFSTGRQEEVNSLYDNSGFCIAIFINGKKISEKNINQTATINQIVNQIQIPVGHKFKQFILYDWSNQELNIEPNTSLNQYSFLAQSLKLNIQTNSILEQKQKLTLNKEEFKEQDESRDTLGHEQKQQECSQNLSSEPKNISQNASFINALKIPERMRIAEEQMKTFVKFSLVIDYNGEYVIYKFHPPINLQGCFKKYSSQQNLNFNKQNYDWVTTNKIKYSEISYDNNCGFIIQWDNGNISHINVKYL